MWGGVQIKARGALPMTAVELRGRLRIQTDVEDTLLGEFLGAAASYIEGPDGHGLALMDQTWTRTIDDWDVDMIGGIALPGWPITGVSEVRYLDQDGVAQILDHGADLRLVAGDYPARLVRKPGVSLPRVSDGPGVIEVDYTLGRASVALVDPGLITALALLAGHYYENREGSTPVSVKALPMGVEHIMARFSRGMFS